MSTLILPCFSMSAPTFSDEPGSLPIPDAPAAIPSVSLKRKGRVPPPYGSARCTSCRRPPTYRNSVLVACNCGAPPNMQAPAMLVRHVGDDA